MTPRPGWILAALLPLAACAGPAPSPETPSTRPASERDRRPVAYVQGRAVAWSDLRRPLVEIAGGEALSEIVLDQRLDQRLESRDLRVTAADRRAERERLLARIGRDAKQAARLLRGVRNRRGLGKQRFDALLWRNAALRKLVAGEVEVTDAAIRQAYAIRYGKRYLARLITVSSLAKAHELRERIASGTDFATVAAEQSLAPSARRGGLLKPISPADPDYPASVRKAITKLAPGDVSSPIALADRFALIKLEKTLAARDVELAEKRERIARAVRERRERRAMERLARSLVKDADVVILHPPLERAWQRYRASAEGAR